MICMMMHAMDHNEHSGHDMQDHRADAPQQESPLDILKRRYALGEINLEQFREMQRVLELSSGPTATMGDHSPH